MNRTSLSQADFVIANNSASPTNDASATQILNKSSKIVYSQLARCIDTGGTAVFMCKPFGTLFDLLELVESIMAGMGITERQDSVFGSKLPLGHGKMIESKRLITHKSIHTVFAAKPQVVFLDYSEQAQETLEAFMNNLAPIFANARFNLLHCPFNTSASESELISLLESIQPGLGIAIPHGSSAFNSAFSKGTVGLVDPSCGPFAIPIDSTKRSIKIDKAVAMGGGLVGDDAWSVDGLIRVDSAGGCVLREDGGRGRMVVLKEIGLVRRILDRALVESSRFYNRKTANQVRKKTFAGLKKELAQRHKETETLGNVEQQQTTRIAQIAAGKKTVETSMAKVKQAHGAKSPELQALIGQSKQLTVESKAARNLRDLIKQSIFNRKHHRCDVTVKLVRGWGYGYEGTAGARKRVFFIRKATAHFKYSTSSGRWTENSLYPGTLTDFAGQGNFVGRKTENFLGRGERFYGKNAASRGAVGAVMHGNNVI
ncbi:hypothetical protein HDU98_011089 [Podochytrium sp. JEL0797]|nr:hypothetical protein HDU98_011089 [Podochytrium sp. JEL0797]